MRPVLDSVSSLKSLATSLSVKKTLEVNTSLHVRTMAGCIMEAVQMDVINPVP